jgi:E3 ubiquitin ligase
MPIGLVFAAIAVLGLLVAAASVLALRLSGADPGLARRLAGPREVRVGRLLDDKELPSRAVRAVGRVRCRDPLEMGGGERLVAFHRDVEVQVAGRWRTVERLRETRSFELWDHDGSIVIDPSAAAEPLIVIPKVWRGPPADLEEPHASAVARLAERDGAPRAARAVTRTLNVTDRLLVVGLPRRDEGGRVRLDPPDERGYLISGLELDDAMRLLGGRSRRTAAAGVLAIGVAAALVTVGVVGGLLSLLLSAI